MVLFATILVYGSEYGKGKKLFRSQMVLLTHLIQEELTNHSFKAYSNKPIIMKDYYEVSGSDVHLELVGLKLLLKKVNLATYGT
jgi:hypothetical protein